LSQAYKTTADLEVQLNPTKSNLVMITANNEMLETALQASTPEMAGGDVGQPISDLAP
jgi:hypothetical protein